MSPTSDYPPDLACNERSKEKIESFKETDLLFLGYRKANIDSSNGQVTTATLRLPDLSCNWERFSQPQDVRFRENGLQSDGCLSITVQDVRYEEYATAVHDPICGEPVENYSHCEVRTVQDGSDVLTEPPKKGAKRGKQMRLAWRRHVRNKLQIVIEAVG